MNQSRALNRKGTAILRFSSRYEAFGFPGIRCPKSQESQTRTMAQDRPDRPNRARGFTLIELVLVVTFFIILASITIPNISRVVNSFRASSNARDIASQLDLAKMRAADGFTQTRLNCTLTSNTCQLQICTTKGATSCTTFTNEVGTGPIVLAPGMSFGFGSITTPAGAQTTIQNASSIVFNSRSIPVDNTGAVTSNDALYLTNQAGEYYAVTVYASGRVAVWRYSNGAWSLQ